jgi:hypothetical protein
MSQDHNIDPAPEAEWQVWYQDTFDRECPRQVEVAGRGLAKGLIELWARHLFEKVRTDGKKGFSRFNLWWKQKGQSIEVVGEWEGATRVRAWVFGEKQRSYKGYVQEGDEKLLSKVAATHAALALACQTSEIILAAARIAINRKDFEARLLDLEKGTEYERE